ncbi:MAG: DUF4442 domain-containing protein [Bacteroidota bacterium]
MGESFYTKRLRWYFNFFPAYRSTGARITYIQRDFQQIKIKLPLNRRTKNYVGTIFGGSMFSAADPIYMVMLIRNLGKKYIVWDKSGEVKFVRPGTETLYGVFDLKEEILLQIKEKIDNKNEGTFDFFVDLKTKEGKLISRVSKKIYVADKEFYNSKRRK